MFHPGTKSRFDSGKVTRVALLDLHSKNWLIRFILWDFFTGTPNYGKSPFLMSKSTISMGHFP
jgi:hypothetical protein